MLVSSARTLLSFLIAIGSLLWGGYLYSIDNPDSQDFLGEFAQREQQYQAEIDDPQNGTQEFLNAYREYEQFLDEELNSAYQSLATELDEDERNELRQSQRAWLAYRDAEFSFIEQNWTRENFGSSSAMSRGTYRAKIIRNRVIALLHYLKNY